MPFITVHPYTPEEIEVHWESATSTLRNSYNFTIFYSLSGEDDSVTLQAANYLVGFDTIDVLQPDTAYIIKVCLLFISTCAISNVFHTVRLF